MKHASITLPQDLWEYLDTIATKLKCSRAGAAAHVIREHKNDKLMERVEALEKLAEALSRDVAQLTDKMTRDEAAFQDSWRWLEQ